jgi:hypothetical protein
MTAASPHQEDQLDHHHPEQQHQQQQPSSASIVESSSPTAQAAAAAAPLALAGLVALLWCVQPTVFWAPCPILSMLLQP